MRLASGKFKHLETIKPLLEVGVIPDFTLMNRPEDVQSINHSMILRSALKNEAKGAKLLSGKSVSIPGIDSWQKLLEAWNKIQAQSDLEEVILQDEIHWETHLTLIYENDFFFVELKRVGRASEFIYWTPLAHSLHPLIQSLKKFLEPLKTYLKTEKFWLMELGSKQEKLFLFQVHPVSVDLLSDLFSTNMVAQIVSARVKFSRSQGLWSLLKTEWSARSFRRDMKQTSFHPGLVFLNWEYLFHYFRLFCMMNRLQPNAQSFASFLTGSFKKTWFSDLVKKHLELANYFRKSESFDPMKLGFEGTGLLFIGRGQMEGVIGEDIHVCEEISLELLYRKQKPKVILTKEVGILSHPVLASVENGVALVLGVESVYFPGERIYLDFDRRMIQVK